MSDDTCRIETISDLETAWDDAQSTLRVNHATAWGNIDGAIDTLEAKGTERCNADDESRADDFFAQGIALMTN